MAANWQSQVANGQYPYQPSTGYQQAQPGYQQQQSSGYNAAAYQQYYAQYYAAHQYQQQQAWSQGQYSQQYQQQQQAWPQGQHPQQHPVYHGTSILPQAMQQPIAQPTEQVMPQIVPQALQQAISQQASIQPPSTISSSNPRGSSCYNCGSHTHWAAACPQPSNSLISAPPSVSATAPTVGQHKKPIVTKYAVPPHVLAQMKARGIGGSPAVAPIVAMAQPQYPLSAQYPGWQQWQGQTYPQGSMPPNYQQSYPQVSQSSAPQPPENMVTAASMIAQTPSLLPDPRVPGLMDPQDTAIFQQEPSTDIKDSSQSENPSKDTEDASPLDEEANASEDDLGLLDVPDMPASYGTSEYNEPKLLAKPLYSVAPEWTSPGFGEFTPSQDPDGYTLSDYIRPDSIESGLTITRIPGHEADPVFAIIDLDAPATSKPRSGSGDSNKSEFETPQTYDSEDTRPTSVDGFDDMPEHADQERSWSPRIYQRHNHGNRSPRHDTSNNQKRKKRRDRGGRNRDRRGRNGQQGKKRKHTNGAGQDDPRSEENEPQAKKHQPDIASTTNDQVVTS